MGQGSATPLSATIQYRHHGACCPVQVEPRNDTIAGPRGRRGDQVGGYTLMHTADLRRVAPKWVSFSEDVRADPDVSARLCWGCPAA